MIGLLLCFAAALSCYVAGKHSRGSGLAAVLVWGYSSGLLRAYFADSGAYFVFDSALVGLYITSFIPRTPPSDRQRISDLQCWVMILIAWPFLMALLPFQPPLISLVGLRASVLVLPAMLVGSRLHDEELANFSVTLALLNIIVFIVAVMEYSFGLEKFFPQNSVTTMMFQMNDVANHTAYRIPATFSQAHVYAGTMMCTIPFLFGAWSQTKLSRSSRVLVILGLAAALMGVLLAGARMVFVMTTLIMIFASFRSAMSSKKQQAWYAMIVCIASMTVTNARLQRFTTLSDTQYVENRIAGSVNRTFFEILIEYPWGNGLGGGGTSIPYFLEGYVNHPIAMESEYARILLEQSVFGLLLWIAFLVWIFTRAAARSRTAWQDGRRVAWFTCLIYFCSGFIGVGLFTAIPSNVLLFSLMGWFAVRPPSSYGASINTRFRATNITGQPKALSRLAEVDEST